MKPYRLNPYVQAIRIGENKFLIKHGITSKVSFTLNFDDKDADSKTLLLRLLSDRVIPTEDLISRQVDDEKSGNELLSFLLEQHILLPPDSSDADAYYHLIDSKQPFTSLESTSSKKIQFVTSSDQVAEAIRYNLANTGMQYIISSPEEEIDEQAAFISVLFGHFDSDFFHKIDEMSVAKGIPLLIGFIDGSTTFISPISYRGITVSYNEMEIQLESTWTHTAEYRSYKEAPLDSACYPNFALNPLLFYGIHLPLDYLVTGKMKTKNRAIVFDAESLRYDFVDIMPFPNNPSTELEHATTHDYL